jgi:DNA-binding NarL/FixJ family response regulator
LLDVIAADGGHLRAPTDAKSATPGAPRDALSDRPMRVLLVESSQADAERITRDLQSFRQNVVVKRVESDDAIRRALKEFAPDVVLADRAFALGPDGYPFQVLRAERPAAPVIMLADRLEDASIVGLMRDGADDMVLKNNVERLGSAIDAAVSARRALANLSPRQLEVMRLVAEGMSTREIADKLSLSVKTVESHRGAMMKRLGLTDVAGLVRYAVRRGLVRPERFDIV